MTVTAPLSHFTTHFDLLPNVWKFCFKCQFLFCFLQEAANKGLNIRSFLDGAWQWQRVDVLVWTGLTVQAAELLAHPTPPGAAPVDFVRIHLVHLLVRRVVRRPAEKGRGGENLLLLCSHGIAFQTRRDG